MRVYFIMDMDAKQIKVSSGKVSSSKITVICKIDPFPDVVQSLIVYTCNDLYLPATRFLRIRFLYTDRTIFTKRY